MKNYQKIIVEIIFSLFVAMLFLFFTSSIYFALIIFVLFSFLIALETNYFSNRYDYKINFLANEKEFILNFLQFYRKEGTISSTLEELKKRVNPQLVEQINSIDEFNELEKINYLKNYFNSKTFDLFVNDLGDGVNIKNLKLRNKYLEIYKKRENQIKINKRNANKNIIEGLIVWISLFTIFGFTSLFFKEFYINISSNSYFNVGIFIVFLVFLMNISINIRNSFDCCNLEGGAIYEKSKNLNRKSKFALQKRDK